VTDGSDPRPRHPDRALIGIVARAHAWAGRLVCGEARSIAEIAAAEGVTDRYVRRLLDLAFLAPDIVAAILEGSQPADLSAERLTRLPNLPAGWAEQQRLLGFV